MYSQSVDRADCYDVQLLTVA